MRFFFKKKYGDRYVRFPSSSSSELSSSEGRVWEP
jgi:hypothetical protein